MTRHRATKRGVRRVLAAMLILVVGCGADAEVVDRPALESTSQPIEEAAAPPPTPTTAEPAPTSAPLPPAVTPVPAPVPRPADEPRPAQGDLDQIQGFGPDARFGYVATTSPWVDPTECGGEPSDSLAGVDVEASTRDEPVLFPVGLFEGGDVHQLRFAPDGRGAALLSCVAPVEGDPDLIAYWLRVVELDENGRVASTGPRIDVLTDGESPFFDGWHNATGLRISVYVPPTGDGTGDDGVEHRVYDAATGRLQSSEFVAFDDEPTAPDAPIYVSPDGAFRYRAVADPAGRLGCEGFGYAVTLEVDDGTEWRSALGASDRIFSDVSGFTFGPDRLVLWTSSCEGFVTAWVGRIVADGTIADVHWIDTFGLDGTSLVANYTHFGLTEDGSVVGLGSQFDADGAFAFLRYDLADDPLFVTTADPPPLVEFDRPLAPTFDGDGNWYVGETLAPRPACGATTLYADTPAGLVRPLPAHIEIDTIVDLHVSAVRTVNPDTEFAYASRTIVVSTECPGEYEGVRLWFGTEFGGVEAGSLNLELAAAPEVAKVLGLREVANPNDPFDVETFAEVLLPDGTLTELELTAAA